ncbi:PH domain-containing protein [Actinokineospora guangxiensis]|uniref:PH domain-containing protein n=1 Tax=Actinokineospora guangxiensis TaxID=1490288 RepID=A0ABW0ENU6_9PSEU
MRRRTIALQRGGIIGWRVVSSPFQRRLGLATLVVATSANSGAYVIPDVDAGKGLAFADEALPGLLGQFLERGKGANAEDMFGPGESARAEQTDRSQALDDLHS